MIVFADIDCTLADPRKLIECYLIGPNKNWDTYFKHTLDIPPIPSMIKLIRELRRGPNSIYFGTGRPESNRELTYTWLISQTRDWFHESWLKMRRNGDYRPGAELKLEWAQEYKPDLFFEDEPATVELLRSKGFTVVQVHGYRVDPVNDRIPA